MTGAENQ
jgi:ATP-dependent exoDNAse (exonuclease V) alpha subunit